MSDILQQYLNNKSKLISWIIELLYAFTLLLFAIALYGKRLNYEDFIDKAKSFSFEIVIDVVGILICYFLVAVIATVSIFITMLVIDGFMEYLRYLSQLTNEKPTKGYSNFKKEKEEKTKLRKPGFKYLIRIDERSYSKMKEAIQKNKYSIHSGRILTILIGYLIIGWSFNEISHSWYVYLIILLVLFGLTALIFRHSELEDAAVDPSYFKSVEEERLILETIEEIDKSDFCFQQTGFPNVKVKTRDFHFKLSEKSASLGSIFIVDRKFMVKWVKAIETWRILLKDGQKIILVDLLDLFPEELSTEENLLVIKPDDIDQVEKLALGFFSDKLIMQ